MIGQTLSAIMYPFLFVSVYFQMLLLISFFENRKKIKEEEFHKLEFFPKVSISIPCWNEEKSLSRTLESLLCLDYPKDKIEIIIVDDGSKDNTFLIAKNYENKFPKIIKAFYKENGGKHTAVNFALEKSTGVLFGCLDADSFVAPHTLKTIVSYFENNSEIMAVTPCIHIRHPRTFAQRLQAIEYLMGVFLRKAYGELDAIQVTPGPFSIFKREVFEKIGPYRKAYNTEDFEITLRMHKHHMKIANAHKALVYTLGPSTLRGYFFQRLRWARGFLENSLEYKDLFFKSEYGNFGMFTLPIAFVFVFYGLYATMFTIHSLFSSFLELLNKWFTVGIHFNFISFEMFYFNTTVMSFIAMLMFTVFIVTLYIGNNLSDDKQQFYKNFPFFFFLYPMIMPLFLVRAIVDTFFKRKVEWVLQDNKK